MSVEKTEIVEAVKKISSGIELFYQQRTVDGLLGFQNILDNLTEVVDLLFVYKQKHIDFMLDESKIQRILVEAMQALEEKDYILVADILQYDFLEYITELLELIE